MEKAVLNVEGMACSHCVNAIKTAVGALDGVGSGNVEVDLANKTVTVMYDPARVSTDIIKEAIEDQGYDII